MVFTHLPSNVLLMLVPLMPSVELAVVVLLLRFSISQMDVPTRQSYTMAVVDPYERARREFNRVEAMGLVDAGERTRYVSLVVEVLRDYLAARYPEAPLSHTSREVVGALRRRPAIAHERLSRVLHEADLAKFAAWTLTEPQARALGADARAIVEREHEATRPTPETEPKAA